jgi:uncharacterized protein YcsI (UPF0317 family)
MARSRVRSATRPPKPWARRCGATRLHPQSRATASSRRRASSAASTACATPKGTNPRSHPRRSEEHARKIALLQSEGVPLEADHTHVHASALYSFSDADVTLATSLARNEGHLAALVATHVEPRKKPRRALNSPAQVRAAIREGSHTGPTCGLADGYAQANLVVLPRAFAYDFLVFCQRNPKPCPLLDVTEVGDKNPLLVAPGADLSRDIPLYRVYREGALAHETRDPSAEWGADMVAFLLGCSFSFEEALAREGIPLRHVEMGVNVPMYITNRATRPAGVFSGPLVVSMRPMTPEQARKARAITARFPRVHGAPIHVGDPAEIGIRDLARPDFGDPVRIDAGEVPVFWACGVTPQAALLAAKPPLAITHAPGHMVRPRGNGIQAAVCVRRHQRVSGRE